MVAPFFFSASGIIMSLMPARESSISLQARAAR
jgi:hypothetical protein